MNLSYVRHINLILPGITKREEFFSRLENNDFKLPEKLSLKNFDARKHVSDRRVLKAISHRDSYSIAAVEQMKKDCTGDETHPPHRRGLFVGACPSSMSDYDNYLPSVKRCASAAGTYDEQLFGGECMSSRPTTLLLGLPNNVLCYGAMLLDARGPNNNFVSEGVSTIQALMAARRSLAKDQIDVAYVGGYSEFDDPVKQSALNKLGRDMGRTLSDGAGFLTLSRQGSDDDLVYYGTTFRSAENYLDESFTELTMAATRELLEITKISAEHIRYIFVPEQSWLNQHHKLRQTLAELAKNAHLISLSTKFGYLSEVSGLVELAAIAATKKGQVDRIAADGIDLARDQINQGFGLIINCSLDGDIAISLIK